MSAETPNWRQWWPKVVAASGAFQGAGGLRGFPAEVAGGGCGVGNAEVGADEVVVYVGALNGATGGGLDAGFGGHCVEGARGGGEGEEREQGEEGVQAHWVSGGQGYCFGQGFVARAVFVRQEEPQIPTGCQTKKAGMWGLDRFFTMVVYARSRKDGDA